MYNVQLSEFWKQRCTKESIHNAPYLFDTEDTEDVASVTSGRTPSMVSVASTATQQKVRVHTPTKINSHSAEPSNSLLFLSLSAQVEELTKKLEEERKKRMEVENMLASVQDGKAK